MKDYKDLNSSFMYWYLTKIIYRIFCGDGNHRAQFDEQLRLIHAEDDLHAFQKARAVGHHEQDNFLNDLKKPVHWKFIDVSEIYKLGDLVDGAEMYSHIHEEDDADIYIRVTQMRAKHILENSVSKSIKLS